MMKRFVCFAALLVLLSCTAFAIPIKWDGQIGPREYNDTLATLQIPKNESNNNLSFAYLHWVSSPTDYSVYLGLQYYCTDHAIEDGLTGVEVRINDVIVGTLFADGTEKDVDRDRFELEAIFDVEPRPPYEVFCEIHVGIKFWPDGDVVAGVRILDFSGNPSNYYRQLVYSPYTTTTKPSGSTMRTTTEKKTTTATKTTATETTVRSVRTTAPVITAAAKREPTATTAASAVQTTAAKAESTAARTDATAKAKTTKSKAAEKSAAKRTKTTRPTAETTAEPYREALMQTSESAETTALSAVSASAAGTSGAQMYSELNKVKIVGTVLVAVILTAAIMASVFLGMRQKQEKDEAADPPKKQNDPEE